ncbi:MAG: hypothetical protein RBS57_16305 [Desulforhabdus sp.]|jgi:hypothetical protein|nr:hypothetical protein [Desulforhabdus sp.]
MKKVAFNITACCSLLVLFGFVHQAGATQVHAEPEGLWAHQIAHLFFLFSMGILIFWLREWKLVKETGWRLVQYSAFFFILWNIDAIVVHYLDERNDIYRTINAGTWHARVVFDQQADWLGFLYYIAKLDHLLCVPAILLLYAGLRQLFKQAQSIKPVDKSS